ncbi:MAG: hypothetical protein FJ363_11280 [Gemmatimonadetes bacterium]|nr:hypothetical protein [Gemmatimonadota bacterium]
MTTRLALTALVLSCTAIAGAYLLAFLPGGAPPWAPWGLAFGSAGALSSMMALGAVRGGRIRPVPLAAAVLTFLVVFASFALALVLPPNEGPGAPLLLGLPVRAAIVLYGVGLVPILFLPWMYAASFNADTLSDADLERVRRAGAERQP